MDDKRIEAQHVMRAEKIVHPSHYGGDTTYEHIKVVEAWGLNYALGSATKYICRAAKKGDILENLKKARFWIEHEITRLEKREHLDNLLSHPFGDKDARYPNRCTYEISEGSYCGLPPSKHRTPPPRKATCEELDCDLPEHSPYCSMHGEP